MRQRLLEARRKESGFTLIELLIVIVILGVLAAVVVLAVGAFQDRGQSAACKSDVKAVEVAVEAYRAKNGSYPTSLDILDDGTENYLRSIPATQTIGGTSSPTVSNQSFNGQADTTRPYYITYWTSAGSAIGSLPAHNAGEVWGDIRGGNVTKDCSA